MSRQLLAASPEHTFLSRYFLGNLDKCYRAHPWCDLGCCAAEEVGRCIERTEIISKLPSAGVCLGADFEDFNACHRLRDMAGDLRQMHEVLMPALVAAGSTQGALNDWQAVGRWVEAAALNCWMRLEGERTELQSA